MIDKERIAAAAEHSAFEHAARLVKQYRAELKHAKFVIKFQSAIISGLMILLLGLAIYERYHH